MIGIMFASMRLATWQPGDDDPAWNYKVNIIDISTPTELPLWRLWRFGRPIEIIQLAPVSCCRCCPVDGHGRWANGNGKISKIKRWKNVGAGKRIPEEEARCAEGT